MFLNIVVNPETAHFEADLKAELQKTYRRLNITYEIVKMTGQALQKNAKYSQIAEISEIKFSRNYILLKSFVYPNSHIFVSSTRV